MVQKSRPKTIIWAVVGILIILLIAVYAQWRTAEKKLQQLSVRPDQVNSNQEQNRQIAKDVIAKVGRLIALPVGLEPTVAKIVDVETLKKRNAFYARAENGDFLVVTPDRAILYSTKKDQILDVVPVQIQTAAGQQQSAHPMAQPQQ